MKKKILSSRSFSYRTTGCKDFTNCITDDIKACNNGGMMLFWADICLFLFL